MKVIMTLIGLLTTACSVDTTTTLSQELLPIITSIETELQLSMGTDKISYIIKDTEHFRSSSRTVAYCNIQSHKDWTGESYETKTVYVSPVYAVQFSSRMLTAVLVHEMMHCLHDVGHIKGNMLMDVTTNYNKFSGEDYKEKILSAIQPLL